MSFTHALPFSADQLQSLMAWSAQAPCGLSLRLRLDHPELDEVAELFRPGQHHPAYSLTAVSTGEIDIEAEAEAHSEAELGPAFAWIEQRECLLTLA